jgi:hypothetical protein
LTDCHLEYVFDIEELFGPLPGGGHQGYTPTIGGTISDPLLIGCVVWNSGADYATARDDGMIELRTHYLLQADDVTLIYI